MTVTINIALLWLTTITGVFFVVTGWRKAFIPDVHAKVFALFASHGVPTWLGSLIVAGEFLGGIALVFGFLTHLAAFGLLVILTGAYAMDTWPSVKAKQTWHPVTHYYTVLRPDSWGKLVSNALCTPEAQLWIVLATITMTGAGAYSLDGLLF